MKFTEQEKEKLKDVINTDYNKEDLKEFIAKCIGERALLICSLNNDNKDEEKKIMLEYLKELQEIAINRLDILNKEK